jgi:hypothetical protein
MKILILAALATLLAAGCAGTGGARQQEVSPPDDEVLRRYEEEFQPSDYEEEHADSGGIQTPSQQEFGVDSLTPEPTGEPEVVSGYRVQVFSTSQIDTAKARLTAFQAAFPDEWFYLDFDPPTYKIRAGNFLSRYDADRFARMLADQGFRSAWSVPQRVFKNPPPPGRKHRN